MYYYYFFIHICFPICICISHHIDIYKKNSLNKTHTQYLQYDEWRMMGWIATLKINANILTHNEKKKYYVQTRDFYVINLIFNFVVFWLWNRKIQQHKGYLEVEKLRSSAFPYWTTKIWQLIWENQYFID